MFHVLDSVTKRVARHISMFRNRQGLGILDHSTWCSRAGWVDHQSFKRDFVAPSQCGFRPGRRPAGFVASHFVRIVTLLAFGMYVRRHMDLLFHHAYSGFDEWHRCRAAALRAAVRHQIACLGGEGRRCMGGPRHVRGYIVTLGTLCG